MRPTYLRDGDLKRKQVVVEAVCDLLGLTYRENALPKTYRRTWDFAIMNPPFIGGVYIHALVKTRHIHWGEYETILFSAKKWKEIQEDDKHIVLFLGTTRDEGIHYIVPKRERKVYPVVSGGRTDRGDADDLEAMISIPISEWVDLYGPEYTIDRR